MRKIILIIIMVLGLWCVSYAADVNEGSTAILTMTFRNELGATVTPTTTDYRLDSISTGALIRNWTSITPASVANVEITNLENTISSSTRAKEVIRVTVRWTYDTTKHGTAEYRYNVVNLAKIQ